MAKTEEYQTLLAQSMEELRLKTELHNADWGLGTADWSVDQELGQIVFSRNDAIVATAPVQIVATYNSQDNTWLWAWDHPSVVPELAEHAKVVQEYGKENFIEELTTRKLTCTVEEAWELTALACKLCAAQGAYRGPAGTTFVFMTFGNVTLRRQN